MPKPSVGRSVHYVSYGTPVSPDGSQAFASECRAAIVTEVGGLIGTHATIEHDSDEQALGLCILNPTGLFFNQGVIADQDAKRGGTWHWPERVE
jgi:hypothetical protein